MTRFVVVIAVLLLGWLAYRWFMRTPPQQVARVLKRAGLALFVLALLLLAVTGRLNWIVAAGAAALPFLRRAWLLLRFLPLFHGLYGRYKAARAGRAPKSGQQSTVESRFLRMSLDHDSGDMDGEVQEGRFADRWLSQMTLMELLDLRADCAGADPESLALLDAYLDRNHPAWREQAGAQTETPHTPPPASGGAMSAEEAREILGVGKDATHEEILQAHRRLMLKLHPDRGGSDYLAAKINLAKDCLLGDSD